MEGKEVVRTPGVTAGLLSVFLCCTIPSETRSAAARGGDQFLIVERPDRLVALNGYQQSLTSRDTLALQPFVPMRILKDRDLLGDGFTPCMKVEIAGRLYYLIREKSGRLSGGDRAGRLQRVSGTPLGGDTVRVLKGGVLRLTSPDGGRARILRRDERMIRMFESQGKTYVECSGRSPAFGWVTLSPGAVGKERGRLRPDSGDRSMFPGGVRDSVQAVLARTNEILASLFRFFNRRGGEDRPAPHWQLGASRGGFLCTLEGASPARDFPEGAQWLSKDLENALLGTAFEVVPSPDGIAIRPK